MTVPERAEGFRRFFRTDNDAGPLVGFFWDTYYPWRRYRAAAALPGGPVHADDLDPQAFLPDYERLRRTCEENGGDFIWSGAAFWGVPWMEAICGCSVTADHETGSARSVPPRVVDLPAPRALGPWAEKARGFLRALAGHSAGRYPLGTTLMRGLSDLLAAVCGGPDFVLLLHDRPGEAARTLERITDLWIAFADAQLEEIPDFHGGVGSYFYDMWLPGRGCFLQEDAAALLSRALFEELILPGVQRIAACFETTVIHLHPSSYIPVDPLIHSALSAIELHIDLGGPSARDLLPVYRKIQRRKPLVIWGDLSDDDVAFVADNLDPAALAVKVVTRDRGHAERVWKRLKG